MKLSTEQYNERVDRLGKGMNGPGFRIDLDDSDFDQDQQLLEVCYKNKRVMVINLGAMIDRSTP